MSVKYVARQMMKALHLKEKWCAPGTVADTIEFGEIAAPTAEGLLKDQILIEVKATAVNVDDIGLAQDSAGGGWFFHGRKPDAKNGKPFVGGIEYAGVVLALGPEAAVGSKNNPQNLKVGDRVCGLQDIAMQQNPGTWAQRTVAPASHAVRIPDGFDISFVQAAAVPMGAFVCGDLVKRAGISKISNQDARIRILVVGASGGLGTFMLQILDKEKQKLQGSSLEVVAVCGGGNAETVRQLGADDVVDYHKGPFGEQLLAKDREGKFDIVFDFVGGLEVEENAAKVLRMGRNEGKFITAVGPVRGVGDRVFTFGEFCGWAGGITKRSCGCCVPFRYEMGGGMPPMKAADFQTFVVEAGARAEIALEVPFAEQPLREALRRVASRHPGGGKVVINLELDRNAWM